MSPEMSLSTPLTQLLGMKHPVISAGMYVAGGPELVAAVSNAGGLGVIGGLYFTPDELRTTIREVKIRLKDSSLPFGVSLLLPQVGGSARKTNRDYTGGKLDELIDIVACSGARLFVSAVGVAPTDVVDKLHAHGIFYMNLVGHPKHVAKACVAGADIICAQGSEAGGHTGEIPTSVLVPACADLVKKYKSPLTGQPVQLVAAGGICDGRGIAASFMYGASAVWVGTRFVTAKESSALEESKQVIINAGFDSTIRSTIWTGRPLRAAATPYIRNWECNRRHELEELLSKGIIPMDHEMEQIRGAGGGGIPEEILQQSTMRPMSIACGLINNGQQSAADIMEEMVSEAVQSLGGTSSVLVKSDD
ncbi:Nitronate monooxygenase-domain-containing protein [Aspergillus bertholletiae]|uniref:Nitronate monooxygenase-domain-containing protein n=1 Tax=Aspergillus bertholletiae TaxID=1226010 RepID=A0A5N7AZ63_9EURO|nr:Nitronate monooxygenase-domain-containing protein [Aspergillus bertholletiae]